MLVATDPVNSEGLVSSVPNVETGTRAGNWARWTFIVFSGLAFVAAAVHLGLSAYMAGRVMPGVSVAGMEIGGMTQSQAREVLARPVKEHVIRITVGTSRYNINPAEVGATYDLEATLKQAMAVGRDQVFAPLQVFQAIKNPALPYILQLNASTEEIFLNKVVAATGQAPVDAAIVVNNGEPVVQPDKDGRALSREELRAAVKSQLSQFGGQPVTLQPSTQQARIRSAHVQPAVEQTKQLLAVPVTVNYQDKVFTPTLAQKSSWISFQKAAEGDRPGLVPSLSKDGIKHYLQSLAVQINVNPVNRKIHIQNGDSKETQAGKDGLQLDQDALAAAIISGIGAKKPVALAAPTKNVSFKTEYNRSVSLDYGKYIEVNIQQQHLWVYQDHKLVHEAPLTSGAAGSGYPTVTGLFSIQAKQTNRNLNGYAIGYNYNVFVKYWMPFYGNYGLHDASWRNGVFGGQDYIYNGSHGCVNLPEATAAFIFNWADVGTPVWVHH